MNKETLKELGITRESIEAQIVEKIVDMFCSDDESAAFEKLKAKIEKKVQASFDAKIKSIADAYIVPKVGKMIEDADLRTTNNFGEPTSPSMTFKEYLARRAEKYMSEEVDWNCYSKEELQENGKSTYDFRSSGPRLSVMMKVYLKENLEKAAKSAISDVNKKVVEVLEKSARDAIASAASSIKLSVSV